MQQANNTTAAQGAAVATSNGNSQKVVISVGGKNPILLDEKPEFKPLEFAQFIGSLIDPDNHTVTKSPLKKQAIEFKVNDGTANGLIVSIPAETASNDRLIRVIKAVQNTGKQIFAGYMLEEETKNETHRAILTSLNKAGIKFSTFTKIAVNKGLKTWAENKRLKVQILVEKSKVDNLRMLAENDVMKPEVKNLQEVTKKELKAIMPETVTKLQLFLSK